MSAELNQELTGSQVQAGPIAGRRHGAPRAR